MAGGQLQLARSWLTGNHAANIVFDGGTGSVHGCAARDPIEAMLLQIGDSDPEPLPAGGRRDDQAQGVDLGDGAGLADVAPAPLRGAVGVNGEAEQVVGHAPLVGLPQLGDHLAGGL